MGKCVQCKTWEWQTLQRHIALCKAMPLRLKPMLSAWLRAPWTQHRMKCSISLGRGHRGCAGDAAESEKQQLWNQGLWISHDCYFWISPFKPLAPPATLIHSSIDRSEGHFKWEACFKVSLGDYDGLCSPVDWPEVACGRTPAVVL